MHCRNGSILLFIFCGASTPDEKAASKIAKYRELYRDHRRQLDFLPAIASNKHNNRQHFWADSLLSHA